MPFNRFYCDKIRNSLLEILLLQKKSSLFPRCRFTFRLSRLPQEFPPPNEPVSFSRLSRFARKTDFIVTIRASLFFCRGADSFNQAWATLGNTCAYTKKREERYTKERRSESERGTNVFSGKRIPWERGESRQELDFVKRRSSVRVWGWSSMRWEGGKEGNNVDG